LAALCHPPLNIVPQPGQPSKLNKDCWGNPVVKTSLSLRLSSSTLVHLQQLFYSRPKPTPMGTGTPTEQLSFSELQEGNQKFTPDDKPDSQWPVPSNIHHNCYSNGLCTNHGSQQHMNLLMTC